MIWVALALTTVGFVGAGVLLGWWLRGVNDEPRTLAPVLHLAPRPRSLPERARVVRRVDREPFDFHRDGGALT